MLRDVSDNASNQGRWMVRAMNGATSIAASSGVASGLTKVAAWDIATRAVPESDCPTYISSCPAGTTAPGKPAIGTLDPSYPIVDVDSNASAYELLVTVHDHATVPITWNKYSGTGGNSVQYLLDDAVVLETSAASTDTSGEVSLQISKGGKFDLEVALCNSGCCTKSAKKTLTIADTDGAHVDPIVLTADEDKLTLDTYNHDYSTKTGADGLMVGTYFVEWSQYGRKFTASEIPAANLTHLYYGFIPICSSTENDSLKTIEGSHSALVRACAGRDDYKVAIHDPWGALQSSYDNMGWTHSTEYKGSYGQLMALKKAYPHLIILPSVGGWTLSDPFYSFSDPVKRKTFVDSVEEFLEAWKFYDGVDIDWEFPGGFGANRSLGDPALDRVTYSALMRELREMLDRRELKTGRRHHLTSAISAGTDKIARVDYNAVQTDMDHLLVMTYDFYGGWDRKNLGHHTALYAPPWAPDSTYSTHGGIQALLDAGVDSKKLVVGVGMYGRGWSGVTGWDTTNANENDHMTGSATGLTKGTWENGVRDWRCMMKIDPQTGLRVRTNRVCIQEVEKDARSDKPTMGWTYHWDDTAKAGYLFKASTGDLLTYDNPDSVNAKGAYVRSHNLGGLFSWEIDGDNGAILNAMHQGLGHGSPGSNVAPIADAGTDQSVNSGVAVTLDGTGSYDENGDTLTYSWAKTSGPAVSLAAGTTATPVVQRPDGEHRDGHRLHPDGERRGAPHPLRHGDDHRARER